jgi:hypothetical protein
VSGPVELRLRARGVPIARETSAQAPFLEFSLLTYELGERERVQGTLYVAQMSLRERVTLDRLDGDVEATVWRGYTPIGVRPEMDAEIRSAAEELAINSRLTIWYA